MDDKKRDLEQKIKNRDPKEPVLVDFREWEHSGTGEDNMPTEDVGVQVLEGRDRPGKVSAEAEDTEEPVLQFQSPSPVKSGKDSKLSPSPADRAAEIPLVEPSISGVGGSQSSIKYGTTETASKKSVRTFGHQSDDTQPLMGIPEADVTRKTKSADTKTRDEKGAFAAAVAQAKPKPKSADGVEIGSAKKVPRLIPKHGLPRDHKPGAPILIDFRYRTPKPSAEGMSMKGDQGKSALPFAGRPELPLEATSSKEELGMTGDQRKLRPTAKESGAEPEEVSGILSDKPGVPVLIDFREWGKKEDRAQEPAEAEVPEEKEIPPQPDPVEPPRVKPEPEKLLEPAPLKPLSAFMELEHLPREYLEILKKLEEEEEVVGDATEVIDEFGIPVHGKEELDAFSRMARRGIEIRPETFNDQLLAYWSPTLRTHCLYNTSENYKYMGRFEKSLKAIKCNK